MGIDPGRAVGQGQGHAVIDPRGQMRKALSVGMVDPADNPRGDALFVVDAAQRPDRVRIFRAKLGRQNILGAQDVLRGG